jgi:hypothetical protein
LSESDEVSGVEHFAQVGVGAVEVSGTAVLGPEWKRSGIRAWAAGWQEETGTHLARSRPCLRSDVAIRLVVHYLHVFPNRQLRFTMESSKY